MPWSNVALVLNSRDRVGNTPYNAAQFSSEGQNIVQGHIDSVSLNEINFPYDIPNIQAGFNSFVLVASLTNQSSVGIDSVPGVLQIVIAPGFYTGTELAAAITTEIGIQQVKVGAVAGDAPTVTYNETTNQFILTAPVTVSGNPTQTWAIYSNFTFPANLLITNPNQLGKDILSIMGYARIQAGPDPNQRQNYVSCDPAPPPGIVAKPTFVSGSAPLSFTQYVDVCSPQLCKFSEFPGGNTTNLARRGDIICRLYIANNIAIQEVEGVRPFIINRQYYNARIMKWTAGNSIGGIDITLYDDVGQPLQTTWFPRPYQITFNVYEGADEMEQVTDSATGETMTLKKYAPYKPQNAAAWDSASFPLRRR